MILSHQHTTTNSKKKLTRKLEREIAEYREQVQLDKKVREMQERQEKLRRELARESEELERRRRMRETPHDLDADNRQQAAGESAQGVFRLPER